MLVIQLPSALNCVHNSDTLKHASYVEGRVLPIY